MLKGKGRTKARPLPFNMHNNYLNCKFQFYIITSGYTSDLQQFPDSKMSIVNNRNLLNKYQRYEKSGLLSAETQKLI